MFIMVTIVGLTYLNQQLSALEQGFVLWYRLHYPEMLEEEPGHDLQSTVPADQLQGYLDLPKSEFIKVFTEIMGKNQ